MNIKGAIEFLVPNAKFIDNLSWLNGKFPDINENTYNNLQWLDTRPKPSLFDVGFACFNLLKKNRCSEVAELRDEKLSNGVPYLYPPNNMLNHVQIRDDKDRINVLINGITAIFYLFNNQPDANMVFRSQENIVHHLTASEILDMALFASNYGQQVYLTSWFHKDNINAIEIIDNDIMRAYNEVLNYDITTGW